MMNLDKNARLLRRTLTAIVGMMLLGASLSAGRAEDATPPIEVRIGILTHKAEAPVLYEVDPTPTDEALAGARLAIKDDNTTGRFTGQSYKLDEVVLDDSQSPVAEARRLADAGAGFLLADLPAGELLAVADALKGRKVMLFNVGATDDRLRGADCRSNVFHTAPSRAMLADALVQYLALKRWTKLFLIAGPSAPDRLYADALRNAAKKFGLKIVAEKAWDFGPLAKARADSVTQADALVFTRGIDYDIMLVADEAGDFGDYIAYRTWDAKLVAGTQGLVAASWHQTQDAWGSAQLQNRFYKLAKRRMRPIDYQAWTAVRAIGETVTRMKSVDPEAIAAFMRSPDFELAAFKGVPVSFRPWDNQLRQPLLIAQPTALVAVSPQPGYTHERTPLDTLGVDQPETACHMP